MNLKDRLTLLKGGYTKKEIEELAKAEAEAVKEEVIEETEEVEAEAKEDRVNTFMATINNLVDEVKDLKTSLYQQNINKTELVDKREEAEEILASIINPLRNNKED
jgi:uncharacterized protein YoxC